MRLGTTVAVIEKTSLTNVPFNTRAWPTATRGEKLADHRGVPFGSVVTSTFHDQCFGSGWRVEGSTYCVILRGDMASRPPCGITENVALSGNRLGKIAPPMSASANHVALRLTVTDTVPMGPKSG